MHRGASWAARLGKDSADHGPPTASTPMSADGDHTSRIAVSPYAHERSQSLSLGGHKGWPGPLKIAHRGRCWPEHRSHDLQRSIGPRHPEGDPGTARPVATVANPLRAQTFRALSHPAGTPVTVAEHPYEARCACGNEWRLLLEVDDDTEPMATCLGCGADTFDLTDIGELRNAGPGST
jgi:hypothetical protein